MGNAAKIGAAALKYGEKLFRQECRFVAGAQDVDQLPELDLPEVAFAGRSNVGKSSLINALTSRRSLARASSTPGRTQQINFFELGGHLMLVDLPGYGYANASKAKIAHWTDLVGTYLNTRRNLKRVYNLIDARHGIMAADQATMEMLDQAGVPYTVVMTKADKTRPKELEETIARVTEELRTRHVGAWHEIHVTASAEGRGIPELRAILAAT